MNTDFRSPGTKAPTGCIRPQIGRQVAARLGERLQEPDGQPTLIRHVERCPACQAERQAYAGMLAGPAAPAEATARVVARLRARPAVSDS